MRNCQDKLTPMTEHPENTDINDIISLIADELGDEVDEGHHELLERAAALTAASNAVASEKAKEDGIEDLRVRTAAVKKGPRVFAESYHAISQGHVSCFSAAGDLFTEDAPDGARRRKDLESKRESAVEQAKAVRKQVTPRFTGQVLATQRPGLAIGPVIGLMLAVALIFSAC
jgi:hypothetical protein